jgi:hypothetical protein
MANTGHATVTRDPDAQDEFRKRHGVLNPDVPIGNAEALQRAYRASQSRAVAKASLLPIDNAATADLDLDEVEGQLGGDTFHAAAVRGNAIVVVAEDANGRVYKTVLPANDRYVAPPEGDPAEEAASNSELAFQAEVAKLRAEFEAELEKVREELTKQFSEKVTDAREETLDQASEEAQKAQAEAEDDSEGGGESVAEVQSNDPEQGGGAKTRKSTRSRSGGNK